MLRQPWAYNEWRDLRTLIRETGVEEAPAMHFGLRDAIDQTDLLFEARRKIRGEPSVLESDNSCPSNPPDSASVRLNLAFSEIEKTLTDLLGEILEPYTHHEQTEA